MKKDYTSFTAEELLMDDYFVSSMLTPTSESDLFWSNLTENAVVAEEEVLLAKQFLQTIEVKKKVLSGEDARQIWKSIQNTEAELDTAYKRIKRRRYLLSGIAASVLIAVVLSVGLMNRQRISVGYGERSDITLPDGSTVKLNSGSDIKFTRNQKEKIREVSFQGEGYFDVVKDSEPFIVKLPCGINVRVLGTSFNLRAYADEDKTQISLVQGSIELAYNGKKQLMKEGDVVEYDNGKKELAFLNEKIENTYVWTDNKFYFRNLSFKEICIYLEKMYDVKISLAPELEIKRFSGTFYRDTDVTILMDIFAMLCRMEYKMEGKRIKIEVKG